MYFLTIFFLLFFALGNKWKKKLAFSGNLKSWTIQPAGKYVSVLVTLKALHELLLDPDKVKNEKRKTTLEECVHAR